MRRQWNISLFICCWNYRRDLQGENWILSWAHINDIYNRVNCTVMKSNVRDRHKETAAAFGDGIKWKREVILSRARVEYIKNWAQKSFNFSVLLLYLTSGTWNAKMLNVRCSMPGSLINSDERFILAKEFKLFVSKMAKQC